MEHQNPKPQNEPKAKRSAAPITRQRLLALAKDYLPLTLCALALLFALAICIYYIVGPAEGYFHSDCTDTILWAQASFDSGKVFSPDFNYAALLPFGASVWLIPLIAIFGMTMKTHVIGMVIFAVLFALSMFLLMRKMKWSYAWTFGTSALIMLVLSSSEKLREIMWGHVIYYSLGLLLYFFMLALALLAYEKLEDYKARPEVRLLPAVLLLILAVLNATNGFQMLVLTVLPITVGILADRLFDRETPVFSKKNLPCVAIVSVLVLGTLIGTGMLDKLLGDITSGYANAYSSYSSPDDWPENLDKFFMNWMTLLGMDVANRDPLMEMKSIVNILRIGISVILLVAPLVLVCFYKKIESRYTRILAVSHLFILGFLFFGCVCGRLAAANWRLTPLLGSSVLVTVAAARELWMQRKTAVASCRIGVCALAALALLSAFNVKTIADMPFDYGRDNTLHVLENRLEEEGLTYGYATFWRSQAITLISDSKVKVREILVDKDAISTDMYQSQAAWYEDQEGVTEYFVLLSGSEYQTVSTSEWWTNRIEHCYVRSFNESGYYVFVFSENIWKPHVSD